MTPEDESILSAYLDEELDPGERRSVESALATDPALSGRLSGLAAARDAVAGLSRPELPCSVVSSVLAGIEASGNGRRPYFWFATAASILFALILSLRSGLLRPARPPIRDDRPAPDLVQQRPAAILDPGPPAPPAEMPPPVVVEAVAPRRLGPLDDPADAPRSTFLKIVDRPGLRRIVATAAVPDEEARDRVVRLLKSTARKEPEFGRLSLDPGAPVDPRLAGVSEAVATLMDDAERREVLDRLGPDFTLVDEPATDPMFGTILAELGQATSGSGPRGAGLRDDLAASDRLHAIRVRDDDTPRGPDDPTPPRRPSSAAVPTPPVPVVILIVSSRPPGPSSR